MPTFPHTPSEDSEWYGDYSAETSYSPSGIPVQAVFNPISTNTFEAVFYNMNSWKYGSIWWYIVLGRAEITTWVIDGYSYTGYFMPNVTVTCTNGNRFTIKASFVNVSV